MSACGMDVSDLAFRHSVDVDPGRSRRSSQRLGWIRGIDTHRQFRRKETCVQSRPGDNRVSTALVCSFLLPRLFRDTVTFELRCNTEPQRLPEPSYRSTTQHEHLPVPLTQE